MGPEQRVGRLDRLVRSVIVEVHCQDADWADVSEQCVRSGVWTLGDSVEAFATPLGIRLTVAAIDSDGGKDDLSCESRRQRNGAGRVPF